MTNTQPPVTGNTPQPTITPEVGKRYVTNDGWITPPWSDDLYYPLHLLASEYVEPSVPDTFRRDLVARLYVAMVASSVYQHTPYPKVAKEAILLADTLIEAMKEEPC